MLKLALAELHNFGAGNEGKDNVGREPLFDSGLDAERVCCVDKNTCVMRCDNRVDNSGEVVDIGEGFYTEDDIIERTVSSVRGIFWISDNCNEQQVSELSLENG